MNDFRGRLRRWAVEHALPLWAGPGFDDQHGRFLELLTLQGQPIHDAPHRLTVQARQIHTYAVAQKRGWYDAGNKIERAYRAMLRDYCRGRNWAFSIHRNGKLCDPRRDFYAHAFVLLAIGSLVGLTGDRAPLAVADELLDCLDTDFGATEGHVEGLPLAAGPRRQNPHMHLFEALLNLWTNTREPRYLERAGKMFDLFQRFFFEPKAGVLLEYFDEDLEPAPERIVEPGHHSEWAWLLHWYQRETGTPVGQYVEPLLAHVERYGIDREGLLPDELLADGTVRTASRRTWPMTEAIKAFAVHGRTERAAALADRLHEKFLSGVVPGGWMDRFDAEGRPLADVMPASTLYHIMGILVELEPS